MHVTFCGESGNVEQLRPWADAIQRTEHTAGTLVLSASGGEPAAEYPWDDICSWDDVRQLEDAEGHRARARGIAALVERIAERQRPDVAVVWGNGTTAQRAAVAAWKAARVAVVHAELGWFRRAPDVRMHLFDAVGLKQRPTELSEERWDRPLTCDENMRLDEYVAWWKDARSTKHPHGQDPLPSAVGTAGKPVLLVLLQLDHDSAMHYAEGLTTQAAVMEAVRYAAGARWQVVVKEHPGGMVSCDRGSDEVWLKNQRLHDCLRAADAVVTANSNAGLEALLYEKRVVCLADAPYGQLGFTFEARDSEGLDVVLSGFPEIHGPNLENKFLRAFLHYVIFDYCFAPNEVEALLAKLQGLPHG